MAAALGKPMLEITVADPVKQGEGLNAYVTYKVSVKTNLPQYRHEKADVIRRFSDFGWLHDRLADKNKGIIVPPLPEKNAVEKFRFSAEFIEVRRRALDVFVNRVARHPQLCLSTDLQLFLEANEEAWAREVGRPMDSSYFKKRPGDFVQMFKEVQTSLTNAVLGKEKVEEETDAEYEQLKSYVAGLDANLGDCQRQSLRLVKRQKEVGQAFADFGEAVSGLGQCEGGALGRAYGELGRRAEALSLKAQKQATELLMTLEEPLKEYVRIVQSIKNVMVDRGQALKYYHDCCSELEAKRGKLQKSKQAQPPPREGKIRDAEHEIMEGKRRAEVAKERYDLILERMAGEVPRFQQEKERDLGAVLLALAVRQAQLAQEYAADWRTLLPAVQAAKPAACSPSAT